MLYQLSYVRVPPILPALGGASPGDTEHVSFPLRYKAE
jgi:hypothetical protein